MAAATTLEQQQRPPESPPPAGDDPGGGKTRGRPPRRRPPAPASVALRPRAVFIALPLIVLDAFWIIQAEKVNNGPYFTTVSLFANVLFLLTALLALNGLVRRCAPRQALSQAELLLVYTMVAVGAALVGHDMLPGLVQMMGHPFRFSTPANGWMDRFGAYLPRALMVSDTAALAGYYQGHASLYAPHNLRAWALPVALWTAFTVVLFWCLMCLNVLMRKGWQDRERLPFPIVEIPLQMTDPRAPCGRAACSGPGSPSAPPSRSSTDSTGCTRPCRPSPSARGPERPGHLRHPAVECRGLDAVLFYPFAIGLGYLLPLDLLFSCWFFYLFWKAQLVTSASLALDVTPDFPFIREQAFGGYLAILAFMFWNGRNYFKEMARRIWGEPSDLEDRSEALSYRQARSAC
jgi:hypothetical protein